MTKKQALAKYLEVKQSELEVSSYDDSVFECGGREYMILTDEEADKRAKEYILDAVWAFNKSFLDGYSDIIPEIDDKGWEAIVSRCESANSTVLAMIRDKDHFVDDAIVADGRGHFLNTYDGGENQEGEYFIYRMS
jgi:hypothetical protein